MKAPDGTPLKGARLTRALVALEIVGVAPRRARGRWAMSTELAPRRVGGVRVDVSPRLPRDPSALEAEFAREAARTFAAPLEASAKAYAEHYAATSARDDSSARLDADPVAELERLGSGLTARWSSAAIARVTKGKLKQLTEEIDADLEGQVERVVGVRPDLSGIPGTDEALEAASRETVGLMKDVMPKAHERMSAIVLEGYRAGSAQDVIARRLNEAAGIGMRRAAFVARNEMGNLYAAHTETRHRDLGVTHYVWRTSQDERVRATHAAHEGKRFAWDDAPADTGPPGADFNCRCTAEPDLSGVLEEIGGDEPEPADLPPEARLKGWRKEMGWKQGDLATKLGRSTSYVSALERGAKELDDADRRALRLALKGSGLDEAELDALLGTLEGVEAPKADPLTEALKAIEQGGGEKIGPTGAVQLSASEALERLRNAEPGVVRGAELVARQDGTFFESFDDVDRIIQARKAIEVKRFAPLAMSEDEIASLKREVSKADGLMLEKYKDLKYDNAALEYLLEQQEEWGDVSGIEEARAEIQNTKNEIEILRQKKKSILDNIDSNGLLDMKAIQASMAAETLDKSPPSFELGRYRDRDGKLFRKGTDPSGARTWDPKARVKISEGSAAGIDLFGELFGDAKGVKSARGEVRTLKVSKAGDRAYYSRFENFLNVGSDTGEIAKETMVHELCHFLEETNDVVAEASKRILLGRAKRSGDVVDQVFPKGRNPAERGFAKVSPLSKYVGKVYTSNPDLYDPNMARAAPINGTPPDGYNLNDLVGTEVLTMSAQHFANTKSMKHLYRTDEDLFWYVVSVSRGDFR